MSKLFLALLISLFLLAGAVLGFVFVKWNTNRIVLSWELLRQRGYDYLHRSKNDYAMEFFTKGRDLASGLGSSDYRYADSLVDMANLKISENSLDDARKLLRQANSIFEKTTMSEHLIRNALRNEQFRSYCLLANLELKAGKFERAQKLCNKILDLSKQQNVILESLTRRNIASTLLAVGDFAGARRDSELAQKLYNQALSLTANMPSFKDLESSAEKKLHRDQFGADALTASDLLEKGAQYMKKRQLPIAKHFFEKARERALATNDPAIMQIDFQLARLSISQNNFEQAEASLLSLLGNPNFKDNTGLDEVLTKLTLIYRNCGYTEDAARILRREVELRKQEYGADSAKVTSIEIELAQTLESMGQYDEAKKIWTKTLALKQALGDEEDSARLAGVIFRTGDIAKAKPMLERIVFRFQSGNIKLGHSPIQACYQLAAIYLIEGRKTEAKNLMDAAQPYLEELAPVQQILVSEILLDTAMSISQRSSINSAITTELIKQSIQSLPVVVDRRTAVRNMKAVNRLEPFRAKYPKAFDAKNSAKLKSITEASSSYPAPKLQGFPG